MYNSLEHKAKEILDNIILNTLQGESKYSVIVKSISDIDAEKLSAMTNTNYIRISRSDVLYSYEISPKQLEYIDNAMKHVSLHMIKLCDDSALNRVFHCLEYNQVIPEWVVKALKRKADNTSTEEKDNLFFAISQLKNHELISNNDYKYLTE